MPYSICSLEEFENIIQLIQTTNIKKFMNKKVFDKEKNEWLFHEFMLNEFPKKSKKIKFLFRDEFDKKFSMPIKDIAK